MSDATIETTPKPEAATPDQAEERVRTVIGWLLDGLPASAAVARVHEEWKVGQRMAQVYVQRAKQLLAEEAEEEELTYYRRLSQQQRDRLIFVLFRALKTADEMAPDRLRSLANMITAGTKLLESRDRLVLGEAKEVRREQPRQQAAEVAQVVQEAEAFLRRQKATESAWTKVKHRNHSVPPPPPLVRPLDPGEPVFDAKRPFDETQMTAKQHREWQEVIEAEGDFRMLPFIQPGAFTMPLAELENPASSISVVSGLGKGSSKSTEKKPQGAAAAGVTS